MRNITKKFKNSQSNPIPEDTWDQGWLSSSRDQAVTSTGCTTSNTPTSPSSGRKQNFSELGVWPLEHMPPESSNLSVLTWELLLEKHHVLSAGKSKLFMWVPLRDYWVVLPVQKSNLVQVWHPASDSSLLNHFFVTTRFFSPISQLFSLKKICTDCNQQPRSLSSYNKIHWTPSQSF